MVELIGKEYFDFNLSVDILFKSPGVGGVAFRIRDEFNYYAFLIDKNIGYKAIVKVVNSKVTILKMINDGGITLNNWHTVTIKVKAGSIIVYMYDKENPLKTETEKKIKIEDFTFSRGSVGFFVNGLDGFFFDELKIDPLECFSPWQPIPYLEITNINTNIYVENYTGNINEKYTIVDIEEQYSREGPAKWDIINDEIELYSIYQSGCTVYDTSEAKRPSFVVINYLHFQNGTFKVTYKPFSKFGMISIILKYNRIEGDNNFADKEEFFSFDIVNEENESYYLLRKWNNGLVTVIKRYMISETTKVDFKMDIQSAYLVKQLNYVVVEFINEKVTISISQDGENFVSIFNILEESIVAGTVGFGTYKTCAQFKGIYVEPPKLRLTSRDTDFIITNAIEDIPLPSVIHIHKRALISDCTRNKNYTEFNAYSTILAYAKILGSSLGMDFCSEKDINNNNNSVSISIGENLDDNTKKNNLKICVMTRNEADRKRFCENEYESDVLTTKCKVKFYKPNK